MQSKIDIDLNSEESVQKGVYYYQRRMITLIIWYPIYLYILYQLWIQKSELLDDSTHQKIEGSPIFYVILGYILVEPLIRLLLGLFKIIHLKDRLVELQRKDVTKYSTCLESQNIRTGRVL